MRRLIGIAVLTLTLAACGGAQTDAPDEAAAAPDAEAVVRTVYDGFAAGDMALATSRFAEDVEWREADGHPYADGNPYVGADGVIDGIFARFGRDWTGFAAIPETFVAEGGDVVVLGRYEGTYTPTGGALDAPFAHVWTVEDGEVTSYRQLTDTLAWNEAMGTLAPAP